MTAVPAIPEPTAQLPPAPAPEPKPPTQAEAPATTPAERLQQLLQPLSDAYDAAPLPADLWNYPVFLEAVAALKDLRVSLDLLTRYATGSHTAASCAAFAAIGARPDLDEAVAHLYGRTENLGLWAMWFALPVFARGKPPRPLGGLVIQAKKWWAESSMMVSRVKEFFDTASEAGANATYAGQWPEDPNFDFEPQNNLLRLIDHAAAAALLKEATEREHTVSRRRLLSPIGRFWDTTSREEPLVEFEFLTGPLSLAEASITSRPPSSLIIVGEPRSGKSSFIQLLGERLAAKNYGVFEADGADILAGQSHVGEVEARVQVILRELHASRRQVWYVPDILALIAAGTHRGQTAGILDQIAPAVMSRELIIVTEASPSTLTRLLQLRPGWRNGLQIIRLDSPAPAEHEPLVHEFCSALAASANMQIPTAVASLALELSRQYSNAPQAVGSAFDLLKLSVFRALAQSAAALDRRAVLRTLSEASGLPVAILDGGESLDLATVHDHFAQRVMGQPAAVEAVVARIAMLKAGLCDPGRPIGVYLFAGPTGTGKTELAKALAEYLFGSADRMIRLDMSEYQSADSARKILGDPYSPESETLASRVRKEPFSIVLLDEFEKANSSIWDIFLQVFDDGRLTDYTGSTVNFRHTFIFLTTNLGATSHQGARMGFSPSASQFAEAQVLRAVNATFRPEFVNRIDRIVIFQPLTRELMRGILTKELRRILERRGLANREWAVEWESSAIEFLLDRGFSADMGARPLRRAVDQYVLGPLAATLVEHRFPEGDQFLFVRSDGYAVQIEFVDPDTDQTFDATPKAETLRREDHSLAAIALQPDGTESERLWLSERVLISRARVMQPEWELRKQALSAHMEQRNFWDQQERFSILAQYALLDRARVAAETAESILNRLNRSVRGVSHSRSIAARLALQTYVAELGIDDALAGCVDDALVVVEPALEGNTAPAGDWCKTLRRMYEQWAAARGMQLMIEESPPQLILAIGGFGALRILRREIGLHVLERDHGETTTRFVARVRVVGEPPGAPVSSARRSAQRRTLVAAAVGSTDIVRRYREGTSPLVRDAAGWRTGRLDLVLTGQFDLLADTHGES